MTVPDTNGKELQAFIESAKEGPKYGVHAPLRNPERYPPPRSPEGQRRSALGSPPNTLELGSQLSQAQLITVSRLVTCLAGFSGDSVGIGGANVQFMLLALSRNLLWSCLVCRCFACGCGW